MDKPFIISQLQEIYNQLLSDGNHTKANESLVGIIKINSLSNYYIHAVTEYDSDDKIIIELMVQILQEIYNNSEGIDPPVSDEVYDNLYEINRQINNEEIVGASKGSSNKDRKTYAHKYPDLRGTLDKVHYIMVDEKNGNKRKSLEEWINACDNKLGRKMTNSETKALMMPKWDGISGIFECDENGKALRVLKRGDTVNNEAEEMPGLKGVDMSYVDLFHDGAFGVKTEIIMSRDNFKDYCKKYGEFKSPRSAVSSIINSDDHDIEKIKYLSIMPLQIQSYKTKEIRVSDYMENECEHEIINLKSSMPVLRKKMNKIHDITDEKYGYDTDGIVIRLLDTNIQEKLGREDNRINKFEIAYKFPPLQKKTKLLDVFMSVGILGAITPVAKVDPVKLRGNKITNISLGSIDRFESLNLNKGDEVIVKYEVIPYLDVDDTCKKGKGEKFETPKTCPYCGEPLAKQPILKCINNNCESRTIGKIMNYVSKMAISDISIGTITTLYKVGYLKSIKDLYYLKNHKREIAALNGFGEKSINKIIDGINKRNKVYDYELIGSLGIPDVGRKIFKKILKVYTLDELLKICNKENVSKLTNIQGIKEKTARKIIEGIILNEELISFLRTVVTIDKDDRKYSIKVAFTKVRDPEFSAYLEDNGVLVMDSYSKAVDMLIVPSLSTHSNKVDKAKKDGKDILAIDDAKAMFNYDIE